MKSVGNIKVLHLLYVVDLIMLALLVASDLPFRLFTQITNTSDLRALPHGILHRLGECQTGLSYPLIEASVDWKPKKNQMEIM